MAIKYLYLDDDPENVVGQIARALSVSDRLEVQYQEVVLFQAQVQSLLDHQSDFNGLLLDLRLDQITRGFTFPVHKADFYRIEPGLDSLSFYGVGC